MLALGSILQAEIHSSPPTRGWGFLDLFSINLLRDPLGIPYTGLWARMQLAAAVLAHSDSLTNSERTDTLVIFDALLSGLAISKRAAAPKDFPSLLHENVTMVYPSREVTDNHVIPILEVVARIGGAAQVRALRALRDRAAGLAVLSRCAKPWRPLCTAWRHGLRKRKLPQCYCARAMRQATAFCAAHPRRRRFRPISCFVPARRNRMTERFSLRL